MYCNPIDKLKLILKFQEGNDPIHGAASNNQIKVVKLLIEKYHVNPSAANLQVDKLFMCYYAYPQMYVTSMHTYIYYIFHNSTTIDTS